MAAPPTTDIKHLTGCDDVFLLPRTMMLDGVLGFGLVLTAVLGLADVEDFSFELHDLDKLLLLLLRPATFSPCSLLSRVAVRSL